MSRSSRRYRADEPAWWVRRYWSTRSRMNTRIGSSCRPVNREAMYGASRSREPVGQPVLELEDALGRMRRPAPSASVRSRRNARCIERLKGQGDVPSPATGSQADCAPARQEQEVAGTRSARSCMLRLIGMAQLIAPRRQPLRGLALPDRTASAIVERYRRRPGA